MANEIARRLRRDATREERLLWQHLRLLKLEGFHFRRQVPLGGHIVDFACMRARLVVEVDGGQHADPEHKLADEDRDRRLSGQAFRVLRFWNSDVRENAEGVMAEIRLALGLIP